MTYLQFRRKLISLSKLSHRAYWEGRIKAKNYLQKKILLLIEDNEDLYEIYQEHN